MSNDIEQQQSKFDLIVPESLGNVKIRMRGTRDNPLFCLADLCRALGSSDIRQSVRDWRNVLKDKELNFQDSVLEIREGRGRPSEYENWYVTDPGLYRVLLTSRSPNAEPFQEWVFGEVLPSIRKHGCWPPRPEPTPYYALRILAHLASHQGIVTAQCGVRWWTMFTALPVEMVNLQIELFRHNLPLEEFDLFDGSVGLCWSHHRREKPWALPRKEATLSLGEGRPKVSVKAYHPDEKPRFDEWYATVYTTEKLYAYLHRKMPERDWQLAPASVSDNLSMRATAMHAELPARVRHGLDAGGGFVPFKGRVERLS